MSATQVTQLPTALTAEYWAKRIGQAHADSVAAIIRMGTELIEAKAALPHGEWGRLTGTAGAAPLLPFSQPTTTRLMSIARHAALSNYAHAHNLPPSWYTLAVLAALPVEVVEQHLANGVIHAEIERATATQLVYEWNVAQRAKQPPLITEATPAAPAPMPPPPPMTAAHRAALDAQWAFEEAAQLAAERERQAYAESPAPQGAWAAVLGSIGAIAQLAIDEREAFDKRLQPMPRPGADMAQELADRLAQAVRCMCELQAFIHDRYLD